MRSASCTAALVAVLVCHSAAVTLDSTLLSSTNSCPSPGTITSAATSTSATTTTVASFHKRALTADDPMATAPIHHSLRLHLSLQTISKDADNGKVAFDPTEKTVEGDSTAGDAQAKSRGHTLETVNASQGPGSDAGAPVYMDAASGDHLPNGLPSFEEWRRQAQESELDIQPATDPTTTITTTTSTPTPIAEGTATSSDTSASSSPPQASSASEQSHTRRSGSTAQSASVIRPGSMEDLAGTKGRFNHASLDCAAVVLKANPEAKGSSAILTNSKEKYMLNPCAAQKYLIVELCHDILIDAITMADYEFFSSTFKDFTIHVSDRYPPKHNQWQYLGQFRARNSREAQVFSVPNPIIWARFVRIDFTSHYGAEYYCPISFLGVYGNTMMEQYKREEEEGMGIDDDLDEVLLRMPGTTGRLHKSSTPPMIDPPAPVVDASSSMETPHKPYWDRLDRIQLEQAPISRVLDDTPSLTLSISPLPRMPFDSADDALLSPGDDIDDEALAFYASNDGMCGPQGYQSLPRRETPLGSSYDHANALFSSSDGALPLQPNSRPVEPEVPDDSIPPVPPTGQDHNLPPPPPHGARPTGSQETIFKTIMKRLGWLDRNLTLTYQYLEEQSLAINAILSKVEYTHRHQLQDAFLYLNTTTTQQIQALKITCEEIWKSIIFDVEEYEHKSKQELSELNARLNYWSQEIVFEKWMRIAQLILLLACHK
ncbi:hypothetical protein H4R35_001026 [Dimargaris xerosporica]|nr:hypothetical protein H4R35_001026 [Dimargaris xerosporica]